MSLNESIASMLRVLVVAACVAMAACTGGPGELLSTAQLEEKQNNPENARRLYEQIVRDHPGSKEAGTARERLAALAAPAADPAGH